MGGGGAESKQGPACYEATHEHKAACLHNEAAAVEKSFYKENSTSGIPAPFKTVTIIGRPSTVWAELMVCRSGLDWIFNWQRQPLFVKATS